MDMAYSVLFRSARRQEVESKLCRTWKGGGIGHQRAYIYTCLGVTLGSDDLINIPACKANLFHSEGCSRNRATHEGDIGEWAGGMETHPSMRHTQTHSYRFQVQTENAVVCLQILQQMSLLPQDKTPCNCMKVVMQTPEFTSTDDPNACSRCLSLMGVKRSHWCLQSDPKCYWFSVQRVALSVRHIFSLYNLQESLALTLIFTLKRNGFVHFWEAPSRCG